MLTALKKITTLLVLTIIFLPWQVLANQYSSYGGYEHDPDSFPRQMVVGQTGQLRRPQDSPLKDTLYSFDVYYYDPSMLSFDEQGNWAALKEGKTTVSFGLSNSQAFHDELNRLGLGDLKIIVAEVAFSIEINVSANSIAMHRLYNPHTGEHFYTANLAEKNHLTNLGWNYEGIGWHAPTTGLPVYRLYNPNTSDHHYTTSKDESDYLAQMGWNDEGIGWYSGGDTPIHRLYNPNAKKAGSHHFTLSQEESDSLDAIGWNYEGIAWYAVN